MKQVMLYCRAGFEKDCAGEVQEKATNIEVFGFPRLERNSGYVLFECYQDGDAERLIRELDFNNLIFTRQFLRLPAVLRRCRNMIGSHLC